MAATKKLAIPKTLGACADLAYTLRAERLEKQKEVDAIQAMETELAQHIIDNVGKSDAQGVTGKVANVRVIPKTIPTVKAEDWEKVYAYIKKHNAFHLMERRISRAGVQELWDANKEVPGVSRFDTKTLSITKAKS